MNRRSFLRSCVALAGAMLLPAAKVLGVEEPWRLVNGYWTKEINGYTYMMSPVKPQVQMIFMSNVGDPCDWEHDLVADSLAELNRQKFGELASLPYSR